jgi:hypothetical protein
MIANAGGHLAHYLVRMLIRKARKTKPDRDVRVDFTQRVLTLTDGTGGESISLHRPSGQFVWDSDERYNSASGIIRM